MLVREKDLKSLNVRLCPQLLGSPLTASVLRKAGCDIEAEWALWRLGNQ
jgi:hypothetical protein